MKPVIPKARILVPLILFVFALTASRIYNLERTARFLWDESSDLVNIHQIYVEKKLTLVGPISEDGSKVFGSLTYYMLLPFSIIGNFDPVSTAYGAAFWGIVGGILILHLAYKVNRKTIWLTAPIIVLWYPLVETGRWAWNPNLIPFWVTLSLIFFLRKTLLSKFLSGLAIGLSIHHHYLSLFAAVGLGAVVLIESGKAGEIKKFFAFAAGLALAIVPFVIFDLRHPPGLFLSRVLYFNNFAATSGFAFNPLQIFNATFQYFTQSPAPKIALTALVILLLINDVKERSASLRYAGVFLFQVLALSFFSSFNTHYILPVVPFFIVYLIYPRKNSGEIVAYSIIIILLISSVLSFPKQTTKTTWESDISSTRFIANTIQAEIKNNNLLNSNIAVLGSPDPNTYGRRYRDLLLINDLVLRTKGEYEISDSLFIITTSSLESIRKDAAYEIKYFKNGPLVKEWAVPESDWRIFLLSRSI